MMLASAKGLVITVALLISQVAGVNVIQGAKQFRHRDRKLQKKPRPGRLLISNVADYNTMITQIKYNCEDLSSRTQIPGALPNGTDLRQDVFSCPPYYPVFVYSAGNPVFIPRQLKVCQNFGLNGSSACDVITYQQISGTNSSQAVSCAVRIQPPGSAASTDFACQQCSVCVINSTDAGLPGLQVGVTRNCDNLQSVDAAAPSLTTTACAQVYSFPPKAAPANSGGQGMVSTGWRLVWAGFATLMAMVL